MNDQGAERHERARDRKVKKLRGRRAGAPLAVAAKHLAGRHQQVLPVPWRGGAGRCLRKQNIKCVTQATDSVT